MPAKLCISRPAESWGAAGERTHRQESSVEAHEAGGWVEIIVHQGEVNSYDEMFARPERHAQIYLSMDQVRTLATFLASLREPD